MIVAIDTSYYTTSVAAMDLDGRVLADMRAAFELEPGKRGLAPSQVVFNHIRNLPGQVESLFRSGAPRVDLVTASVRPRLAEDSYLPFFHVSEGFGRAIAAALGAPFLPLSHQEGHVAGAWICWGLGNQGGGSQGEREEDGGDGYDRPNEPPRGDRPFLVLQMSGGTTELLIVEAWRGGRPEVVQSLGAALDVNAGQFLDHVGVRLGLRFPAGPGLELLAAGTEPEKDEPALATRAREDDGGDASTSTGRPWAPIPVSAQGYRLSFAGPEAAANRLIESGCPAPVVARLCLAAVARGAEKILRKAIEEFGHHDVVVCGGVASSQVLRRHLTHRLEHPAIGARLVFPTATYCTDNAVGLAEAGRLHLLEAGVRAQT